jgi:hypothetical protein
MKKCVACLTRGYPDFSNYWMLITRNKNIEENLIDKTIDVLIFHEGNIIEEHQVEIAKNTPLLNIKFINITNNAFKKEKESIQFYESTNYFGIGYRHMCSFWFVDFWNFVSDYDYLIRIDEDCYVNSNIDNVFTNLNNYHIISAKYENDEDFVTVGLNQLTLDFISRNSDSGYIFKKNTEKHPSGGPYTNFFGLSLNILRTNNMYCKYIQHVDSSNQIYEKRWGDLPLWGEVIDYIFGTEYFFIDNNFKYHHGSHNSNIN